MADVFYPRTDEETSAGVVPTDFSRLPLDPCRYGAIGDGEADDTLAMNDWVKVLNKSRSPCAIWPSGKIFLCGPLSAITVADFTWQANGSSIKVDADSWPPSLNGDGDINTPHVRVSGARPRIHDLTIDGNQSEFSAPDAAHNERGRIGSLLQWNGASDVRLTGCTLRNSAHSGGWCVSSERGHITDCHFDDNASLGLYVDKVSYYDFKGCTFNRNGNGLNTSFNPEVQGGAFGIALRFRSHHLTFVACHASQNGRDGFNVNQGSYAIKFIGCICWMNNDGGFTIAADQTNDTDPGNGESCYDIEYIDCEAYNSYTSGLAIYNPSYNITVKGGRYYNNHRCAGLIKDGASFNCGIFIAGGSKGVDIDAKAYDDRQICVITQVLTSGSALVLQANGWTPGSRSVYPRVAFYDGNNKFKGYGTITAEGAGSVTVQPTTWNPVIAGDVAQGWRVTQRLQHNGAMYSNGASGTAIVDGWGQLEGSGNVYGYPIMSSWNDDGQNVLVPHYELDVANELLVNPSFDASIANWSFNTPGGGAVRETGSLRRSPGSLKITAGSSAEAYGDAVLVTDHLKYMAGAFVEAGIWAYADNRGDCDLRFYYNAGALHSTTVNHPGGGWKLLKIGAHLPMGSTTQVIFRVEVRPGRTAYFDNASLRVRSAPVDDRDYFYPTRSLAV
jgi:hypothetical protein